MNDWSKQVDIVLRILQGKKFTRDHPTFAACIQWITNFPAQLGEAKRQELIAAVILAFDITEPDIYAEISHIVLPTRSAAINDEQALEASLPKGGWLEWYADYTRETESPLSFHLFSSLCVLGAAVGRRIWKPKGFFDIFCNYCVVLVGPPGRVKKTSAVDVAKDLIHREALCPILADKITPEALIGALADHGGHHFVYAPEFSVLFGKQKYNEGLTTLIIRLLDSPKSWTSKTLGRGEVTVEDVALTVLGGSTMSLLSSSTPDQVMSSGFLNRFLLLVENDSQRSFPEPKRDPKGVEPKILAVLERMKTFAGEVKYTPAAQAWFHMWYNERRERMRQVDSEMHAEVVERIPVHLERTAILLHLALHDDMMVCEECFKTANTLMNYVETKVPGIVTAVSANVKTQDADYVLAMLQRLGGAADHSKLLRRCGSRIDAATFKRSIEALAEAHVIRKESRGVVNFYILEEVING